jgi:hypothetical protein
MEPNTNDKITIGPRVRHEIEMRIRVLLTTTVPSKSAVEGFVIYC